jgi:hypothetical protein
MKKKFVFCFYYDREVPVEKSAGCCEFFNNGSHRCDYHKYSISNRRVGDKFYKLSERDNIIVEENDEE